MWKRVLAGAAFVLIAVALGFIFGFLEFDPERSLREQAEKDNEWYFRRDKVVGVWFSRPVVGAEPIIAAWQWESDPFRSEPRVSDVDLSDLLKFPHLEWVNLDGARIAGPGLLTLADIPSLKRIRNLTIDADGWDLACLLKRRPDIEVADVSRIIELEPLTREPSSQKEKHDGQAGCKLLTVDGELVLRTADGEDGPITVLNLRESRITDADLSALVETFPKARRLDLSKTEVTSAGIAELAQLKDLTHLKLPDQFSLMDRLRLANTVAGLDVSELGKQGAYFERDTSLPGTPISRLIIRNAGSESDRIVAGIAGLESLREFSFLHGYLSKSALREVADLKHLEVLDLRGNRMLSRQEDDGSSWLRPFAGHTELREIWLTQSFVDTAIMPDLASLPNLEILCIGEQWFGDKPKTLWITDEITKKLGALKQLRHLYLENIRLSPDVAESLGKALPECNIVTADNWGKLNLLFIEPLLRREKSSLSWAREECNSSISSPLKDALRSVTHPLKRLELGETRITDSWLNRLTKLTGVKGVGLAGTKVTDDALRVLLEHSELTHLDLERTAITDAGIQRLTALKNLEWLNLNGTAVTDKALIALAGMKSLRQLRLDQTAISDAGVKRLAALEKLEWLSLDRTAVTDDALTSLIGMKQLHYLALGMTPSVSGKAMQNFEDAVPGRTVWGREGYRP